jgi:8-oxo-dGTP diphosphatase
MILSPVLPTIQRMTAPDDYDASAFPPFAVTADTVVFTRRDDRVMVVLVQRAKQPFRGRWALPGGFVDIDEDLEAAARRELAEETGLTVEAIRQLGAYGTPGRDPRMRVVTVVYWAEVDDLADPVAADDANDARLWSVEYVLANREFLAFDHHRIVSDAARAAGL